jgi:hypothetical protein
MGRARAIVGKYCMECSVVTAPRRLTQRRAAIAARLRGIGFLLPTLVLQACFDVHQVDPGSGRFVIDDFEDGDPLPKNPLFQRWDCYTFNPAVGIDPAQTAHCDVERPGYESAYALSASFRLHQLPGYSNGGAALSTIADPMVDLNGYKNIVFSLKVDFGNLPSASYAFIALDCNSVAAEKQKTALDYFQLTNEVNHPIVIVVPDTWAQFRIALSEFTQPDWQKNRFADGPKACLAVVDSVNFEINGQLAVGQSGSGLIHIDEVYLE